MILMRDGSLSPGTKRAHTAPIVLHCPRCPLEVTDTAHYANICMVMDKDRYAMTWDALTEFLMLRHEAKTFNFQQVVLQQTPAGQIFLF